ncbi:hypothetical protein SEVIR_6G086250v4 [Setaria viridis]
MDLLILFFLEFEFSKFPSKRESKKKDFLDQVKEKIYSWSYNCGYIDVFYTRVFILGIRRLAELTIFFDKGVIDGITNGVGLAGFLYRRRN